MALDQSALTELLDALRSGGVLLEFVTGLRPSWHPRTGNPRDRGRNKANAEAAEERCERQHDEGRRPMLKKL